MAREFHRSLGVIPFVANTVARFELPRNHVYKSVRLKLTGTFTVVDGGADGVLSAEQPQNLITLARIIRNGSEILQALDGGSLFAVAQINSDGDPIRTPLAIPGAQVATAFEVDIPIDFASWRTVNPAITMLRSVGTSSLDLELAFGSPTTVVVGGADISSIPAAQVEVFGEELLDITGDFSDKNLTIIQRPVTISQTDLTIDLPLGPLYRRLILKTTANADRDLVNNLVNRIRVESDGYFAHVDRLSWREVQGANKRLYSLVNVLTGYAVIDFMKDGNPAGLIDTRGASQFKLVLDVTAGVNSILRVIPETIIPARVAA
jgi:hypothetical protein